MGTMLKQMWNALAAIFAAIEVLGHASQKGATALDHLGGWCEETAGSFADKARMERQQAMIAMKATTDRALAANQLPVIEGPATTQGA